MLGDFRPANDALRDPRRSRNCWTISTQIVKRFVELDCRPDFVRDLAVMKRSANGLEAFNSKPS
jgi:hypothetical protein